MRATLKRIAYPFVLFNELSEPGWMALNVFWVAVVALLWTFQPFAIIPTPFMCWEGFLRLFLHQGLLYELGVSLWLNMQVLFWSLLLGSVLAYLTKVPFFKPPIVFLTKLRGVSFNGLCLIFILAASTGHMLKLNILVFFLGISYLSAMVSVVLSIPPERYEEAWTLRMTRWQTLWYVTIRQTRADVIINLKLSAAIGWMMLNAAEMMTQGEGGIGVIMERSRRAGRMDEVIALVIVSWILVLLTDFGLTRLVTKSCPWAEKEGGVA